MTLFCRAVLWTVVASVFYVASSGPAIRFSPSPPIPIFA